MSPQHQDVPYRDVFAAAPTPLLVLSPDLIILEANDTYLRALPGYSREQLLGRYLFDVFPEPAHTQHDGVANLRASLERARDTGRPDTMAVQRYDIAGTGGIFEERYWSPIQVPVLDEDGHTMLLLHRAEDVTDFVRARQQGHGEPAEDQAWERRMQEVEADLFARARELQALNTELRDTRDQLAVRVLHDPLTGLLIRPVILEQISRALARTARHPQRVGVLFIDLDRLKQVNDAYGHATGDQLIRCFAEELQRSVRPCDAVARFGGDEFVVLLEDLHQSAEAEAVAGRVLDGVRTCEVPAEVAERPSASVGIAVTQDEGLSAESLIARADQAMYRAKRSGGNRYQLSDD